MSQFNAIAAFIAKFTASSFSTGSTPGYARSIGFTFVFGSVPKAFTLELNIFDFVFSSTCTSSPIIVSKFIILHLQFEVFSYDGLLPVQKHVLLGKPCFHQNVFQ